MSWLVRGVKSVLGKNGSSKVSSTSFASGRSSGKYMDVDASILKTDDPSLAVTVQGGDVVKQKCSLYHVVNNIYYSAPVKVSTQFYPKNHPKKGEEYIWVELDDKAIDREQQERKMNLSGGLTGEDIDTAFEKHKNLFPPGVSVDKQGDILVGARAGSKPINISADDVMAGFKVPVPPNPPRLVSKRAESITLTWEMVLGLVDFFELQYRIANDDEDDVPWHCHGCTVENKGKIVTCVNCQVPRKPPTGFHLDPRLRTSRQWETLGQISRDMLTYSVESIQCGIPYVFRIRAKNSVGWGEYSLPSQVISTLPEPPAAPTAPSVQDGMTRAKRILLQWAPPNGNGRPVTEYEVIGGPVKDGEGTEIYVGPLNYVIIKDLVPNTMYHYKVRAMNEVGKGPFSKYADIRTQVEPGKCEDASKKPYQTDWAELFDYHYWHPFFINLETEKTAWERPTAMDGPIDPIVEFKKKRFRFNKELLKDAPRGSTEVVRLHINRETMLWDSFTALMQTPVDLLAKRIKIDYIGEEGIDAGALSKDWFLELSRQIFDPKNGLFAKLGDGNARDIKMNAAGPQKVEADHRHNNPEKIKVWYQFVGRFLGKAIFDRQLVDVQFSKTLFKQVFGMHVDVDDLRETDPTLVKSMEWMLENEIEDILFEEFCVTVDPPPGSGTSEKIIVDLKPGGRNIEVDDENKHEYVELMLKWRAVDSCKQQIEAIRQGLFEVIPEGLLKDADFELNELEMLWNGLPNIDVNQIRQTAIYQGGIDTNHQLTHWFWKIFKEMEQEDKELLLRFATGSSKMPIDGLEPPFNLTYNGQEDPNNLIKAHACFNQLVIYNYPSEEIMRDKILYAIKNSGGFLLG